MYTTILCNRLGGWCDRAEMDDEGGLDCDCIYLLKTTLCPNCGRMSLKRTRGDCPYCKHEFGSTVLFEE